MGENIAHLRAALAMTQGDLGQAMADAGFPGWAHRQTVQAAEAGKRVVTRLEHFALARVLRVSVQTLMVIRDRNVNVKVGDRAIPAEEWESAWGVSDVDRATLVYGTRFFSPQRKEARRQMIERLRARDANLSKRERLPGPTFISDAPVTVPVAIPGGEYPLKLRAGVPYVARDELEAAALRKEHKAGRVRQVERHAARRMTRKGSR